MKQWAINVLLVGLLILQSSFGSKHEYYISFGEMKLNPQTHHLEMSVRMFSDDLEFALKKQYGLPVDVLEHENSEEIIAEYVKEHFQIWNSNGQLMEYIFMGIEGDPNEVTVYLETKDASLQNEIEVKNALLLSDFPGQINILKVGEGESRRSYRFDVDTPLNRVSL